MVQGLNDLATMRAMRVDSKEVLRIAALARLTLRDEEVSALATDLSGILDYIDQLGEAAAPNAAAGTFVELRDDVGHPSLPVEVVEGNAPSFHDSLFTVPRVLGDPE